MPETRRTELENGVRVLTESMGGVRSLCIGMVADTGPRDEAPGQAGLAHLSEHLLFQGTASRDALQIARLMDAAGGNLGAFTSKDYTCLHATVLDDYGTFALDLFGDLILGSVFQQESLERQREAALHELEGSADAPDVAAMALLKRHAFGEHPLGRPVAGTRETVARLTREDVIYFVQAGYAANRLIVAAAGHVEHDDFVAQVRDAFWRLLPSAPPVRGPAPVFRPGLTVRASQSAQAYFALGIPAPAYGWGERYTLHLLNRILGGGLSSRLFRRVREERGLAYDIGSELHAYRDAGLWVVEGSTRPESLGTLVEVVLDTLGSLASSTEPVDDEELARAKAQIRCQHLIAGEDPHTRMSRLATQELYFGRTLAEGEILSAIAAVDAERCGRVGGEVLLSSLPRAALAVVTPDPGGARAELPAILGSLATSTPALAG